MAEREESIRQSLVGKFGFLDGKCNIARERRLFVEVPREKFMDVLDYAVKKLGFDMLCTITGLDMGDSFQAMYHLANKDGVVLNLKQNAPKTDPVFKTVIDYFNGAALYELEIRNLLGVKVEGLPQGYSYPLPDGWPEGQYPLRKDWKPEMLQQSKGGAE